MKNNIFAKIRKIVCAIIACNYVLVYSLYSDGFHTIDTYISLPCKTDFTISVRLAPGYEQNKGADISFSRKRQEKRQNMSFCCPIIYTSSSYSVAEIEITTEGKDPQQNKSNKTIIRSIGEALPDEYIKSNQYNVQIFKKFTDVGEFLYIILYNRQKCSYKEFQNICDMLRFSLQDDKSGKDGSINSSSDKPRRTDIRYKEWSINNAALFKINPSIMLKSGYDLSDSEAKNDIKHIKTLEDLINVFDFTDDVKDGIMSGHRDYKENMRMKKDGNISNNSSTMESKLSGMERKLEEMRSTMNILAQTMSKQNSNRYIKQVPVKYRGKRMIGSMQ